MLDFWYNPIPTPYQFGILDCELEFNESKHVSSELVPLVAPLVNQTNNMWNYFRVKNNIFLLSKTLSKDLLFDISSSQIIYKNSDGIIAFFGDFLEDFKDTAPFGEPIGYGSYLMVKKSYLENFMEFYNKKVGVLVKYNLIKKKNLGREDRYEENESFEKFLLNI